MTREIKFEVLYKHKSKLRPEIIKKVYTLDDLMSTINLNSNHFIVIAKRQYTGLKDKNGVEVYEGDILYVAGVGRCEVQWDCCGYWAFGEERLDYQDIIEDIEDVIGNIYETPELLQGEG